MKDNVKILSFCAFRLLIINIGFFVLSTLQLQQAYAGTLNIFQKDSLQIIQKLELAEQALSEDQPEQSIRLAMETLNESQTDEWSGGEARSHLLLGRGYFQEQAYSLGMEHMLRAASIFEELNLQPALINSYFYLGKLLMDWPAYDLSLEYFKKAGQLTNKAENPDLSARLYQLMGEVHLRQNNWMAAIKAARKAEPLVEPEDRELWLSVHAHLSLAYTRLNQLDSALYFALEEKEYVSQKGNLPQQFSVYNKLSYLYRLLGQHDLALQHLKQAEQLLKKADSEISAAQKVRFYNNLAVTLLIKGDRNLAEHYFNQSIQIALDQQMVKEEADTRNLLAAAYLSEDKIRSATNQADLSLELTQGTELDKSTAEAYRIKSEAALRGNDYRQSLVYEKNYYQALEKLESQQEKASAQLEQEERVAEQQEQTILDLIDNEEKQELRRQQLEMETKQQKQSLALQNSRLVLLQQEKELQRQLLEKQRLEQLQVNQALSLTQERLEAAEREKELEEMRRVRERQELSIRQQELEEQNRERELELLSTQNQAQDRKLALEARNRDILQIGLLVALLFIFLILYTLYRRNRDNQKLKEQQQLIQQKNEELCASEEELKQNMDQLQFTQEVVAKQKEMLQVTGNFGVWEYNLSSEKINCNDQFLKMLGLSSEEFSGAISFWKKRVHPEDLSEFEKQFENCLRGKEVSTLQYRINSSDSGERIVDTAMRPVYDQGELVSLVGVIMDITHIKENETVLAQKNEDLKKINSELDHFVYRTSHNLRAPLASVMGLVNLMENIDSKEEQREYLNHISSSMVKLDETIQEINNYSKNARLELKLEKVNLRNLVQDIYETLLFMRAVDAVDFSLEIPESLEIISDASRLKIIFNNLLSNAIKYVHPTTGECKIRVAAAIMKGKVEIIVADQGMGIPEEYQEKIFEMFFRATNAAPGSGLGLYIVKEAVNKLDGSIRLESKSGKGTIFYLSLPMLEAREEEVTQLKAV